MQTAVRLAILAVLAGKAVASRQALAGLLSPCVYGLRSMYNLDGAVTLGCSAVAKLTRTIGSPSP